MNFEWDENKNIANIAKHGYDFRDVAKVLVNHAFVYEYHSSYPNEKRVVAIGIYQNRYIAIIYTLRGENIRIISVRKARKKEIASYEKAKKEHH